MAQSPVIDNLLNTLNNVEDESTEEVDVLNTLAFQYYNYNDSLGLFYAGRALAEARRIKYNRGIKYGLTLTGIGLMTIGEYHKAISNLETARQIKTTNLDTLDIYALMTEGNIYRNTSRYDSADYIYQQALPLAMAYGSPKWIAGVRKNIAILRVDQFRNDEALTEATLALHVLEDAKKPVSSEVYNALGMAHLNLYRYDSAAYYFDKMCAQSDSSNYFNRIRCQLHWAEYEFMQSNFSDALVDCYAALKLTREYFYPPQVAEIYMKLGDIYSGLNQYELASKYLFEALRITERYSLRDKQAWVLADLGWINKDLRNFDVAFDFLRRSRAIFESIQSEWGVSYCLNVHGLVNLLQKNYDDALKDFEESRRLREAIHHDFGVAAALFNMSLIYKERKDYRKAYELELQSVEMEKRMGNKESLGISYNQLAELLLELNDLNGANQYLLLARAISKETGGKQQLLTNFRIFATYFSKLGDYKKAYEYQLQFQSLNDSIYTTSSRAKLAEMEALYQLEQREQEIRLLNQEKMLSEKELELQSAQLRAQTFLIVFITIGALLLTVLTWNFYRSKKRIQLANEEINEQKEEIQAQAEELIEANDTIAQINKDLEQKVEFRTAELKQAYKELDTFFYRSSHDFRRPITTFLGLAEVAKVTVKDSNAMELFGKVKETASALDRMIFKLQSVSDVGLNELVYKEVFLRDVFNSIHDQYRDLIREQGIDVTFEEHLKGHFYSYPAMIKLIFENLIENGLLFSTRESPFVKVQASQNDSEIIIKFIDNGQGIDEEYKDRVFDMYFRANHQSKGNGLGLYIVQKAVNKLKGQISFASKVHVGTTFTLVLPMGKAAS